MNSNDCRHSIFSRYEVTDVLAIAALCFTILLWASQSAGKNPERPELPQFSFSSSAAR
jgi:hypothetical protein